MNQENIDKSQIENNIGRPDKSFSYMADNEIVTNEQLVLNRINGQKEHRNNISETQKFVSTAQSNDYLVWALDLNWLRR
jgi:hypothetical protein